MVRSADRKGIGRSHGAGACAEPLEPRLFLHAVSPAPLPTIRINDGGATPFTDSAGNVWEADRGFTGGTASRSSYGVANTTDDRLYYERRWGPFTYSLPVDNGDYTLSLLNVTAGPSKARSYATCAVRRIASSKATLKP